MNLYSTGVSLVIGGFIGLFYPAVLNGEVMSVSENGFVSEHSLLLEGDPETVYKALTLDISEWWDAQHSYSLLADNFTLDAKAGGCFCEQLPDGGSVEHMRVVFAQPGKVLRLNGGLGPLQQTAVYGSMTFTLTPDQGARTRLDYSYVVGGYVPGGLRSYANPVDQVQLGQLQRLQRYLRNGSPE